MGKRLVKYSFWIGFIELAIMCFVIFIGARAAYYNGATNEVVGILLAMSSIYGVGFVLMSYIGSHLFYISKQLEDHNIVISVESAKRQKVNK